MAVQAGRGDVCQFAGQGAGCQRPVAQKGLHDSQPDRMQQKLNRGHVATLALAISIVITFVGMRSGSLGELAMATLRRCGRRITIGRAGRHGFAGAR